MSHCLTERVYQLLYLFVSMRFFAFSKLMFEEVTMKLSDISPIVMTILCEKGEERGPYQIDQFYRLALGMISTTLRLPFSLHILLMNS